MIDSSSVRVKERRTDGDVIVVEVFREPLLAQGLLGELAIRLCNKVVRWAHNLWEARSRPGCQRKCAWFVHDIKEAEGLRQQEVQEDEGDKEIGSGTNGEVEESHSPSA